jgi:hypothetical protein
MKLIMLAGDDGFELTQGVGTERTAAADQDLPARHIP